MQWLHAKDLPGLIERRFGDIVSPSTVLRMRRRYPLALPCKDADFMEWWPRATDAERNRRASESQRMYAQRQAPPSSVR